MINRFNVRVYGIWINQNNQVLISHEKYGSHSFTKFPGGGLEFGEGTHACLKREFLEEFEVDIDIISHFYTTDIFQPSAFVQSDQLISIYYLIKGNESVLNYHLITKTNPSGRIDTFCLKWHDVNAELSSALTFPIDKIVAKLLLN